MGRRHAVHPAARAAVELYGASSEMVIETGWVEIPTVVENLLSEGAPKMRAAADALRVVQGIGASPIGSIRHTTRPAPHMICRVTRKGSKDGITTVENGTLRRIR